MSWLLKRFEEDPMSIAIVDETKSYTYGDLSRNINGVKSDLLAAGVKPGEKIVIKGEFSLQALSWLIASYYLNMIAIPITQNSATEENRLLEIVGVDWYVDLSVNVNHVVVKSRQVPVYSEILDNLAGNKQSGLVLFSSGTSGKPKGIVYNFEKVLTKFQNRRRSTVALPFLLIDHFGGINTAFALLSSLSKIVVLRDRSIKAVCGAIEKNKVKMLPTTPSFLTLFLASGAWKDYDLSSLERITYGTEVMPRATLEKLVAIFPDTKFQQTYGLSELGVLKSESKSGQSLFVKVGGTGFETKVVNKELWIKSDFAMEGYLNAPNPFDKKGWMNTGDLVEVDGDYIKILGRNSDLINVGGQKVFPNEIEEVILELDDVVDVSVFGEAHALLGQIVVAKVKVKNGFSSDDLKSVVRKHCLTKLSPFKAPSKVLLVENDLHNNRHKKVRG